VAVVPSAARGAVRDRADDPIRLRPTGENGRGRAALRPAVRVGGGRAGFTLVLRDPVCPRWGIQLPFRVEPMFFAGWNPCGFSAQTCSSESLPPACVPPTKDGRATRRSRAARISRTSHGAPQFFKGRPSSGTVRATVGTTSASRSHPCSMRRSIGSTSASGSIWP
jgi:hypothetical protein